MSTCPMAALGPPINPQKSWMPKKSQRGKVDSYLIPYQMAHSTLIKRGQAQGCSSMDITQHHCSVKARSTSAEHWTTLAFLQILAAGTIRFDRVHGMCTVVTGTHYVDGSGMKMGDGSGMKMGDGS